MQGILDRRQWSIRFETSLSILSAVFGLVILLRQKFFILTKFKTSSRRLDHAFPLLEELICNRDTVRRLSYWLCKIDIIIIRNNYTFKEVSWGRLNKKKKTDKTRSDLANVWLQAEDSYRKAKGTDFSYNMERKMFSRFSLQLINMNCFVIFFLSLSLLLSGIIFPRNVFKRIGENSTLWQQSMYTVRRKHCCINNGSLES